MLKVLWVPGKVIGNLRCSEGGVIQGPIVLDASHVAQLN